MSAVIYTCEARISIWDDINQRWGGFTDAKNLTDLSITKPEPTIIKDVSSKPDDTFAQTLDSYLVGSGSPTMTISTRDVVNRDSLPQEMQALAAALAARVVDINEAADTDLHFSAYIDELDLNFPMGARNVDASTAVLHKQSALTGLMSGSVASATATTAVVTGAGWTIDALIGKKIMITEGTGAGQVVAITDNDATSVTVAAWSPQPDNTSKFAIVEPTALVQGSAYSVDSVYGSFKAISGGAIAKGDTIQGLIDTLGYTGKKLRGATRDVVTFRLQGKAKDIKSGEVGFLTIHKVNAYSSEAQQFVANAESPEFKLLTLSGELETPAGYDAPYEFDVQVQYAE